MSAVAANKVRVALQAREAMREYREGKPVGFAPMTHPSPHKPDVSPSVETRCWR